MQRNISNYPKGFAGPLTVRGMPILNTHPADVQWVDSTSAVNADGSWQRPHLTIAAALTKCKSARGSLIVCKPGHSESIAAAGGLALNVADVTIIGLGVGAKRAKITLGTANTATITVSAANITVKNLLFVANFLNIATCFDLGNAPGFCLEDCEFRDTSGILNFVSCVKTNATANNADDLTIQGCTWNGGLSTAQTSFVLMNGTNARVNLSDNFLSMGVNNNKAALMAIATTKIVTDAKIMRNKVNRLNTDTATGGILITTDVATNTGIVCDNYVNHADAAAAIIATASSGFGFFNNLLTGDADTSGYVLPAIGTN